MNEKDIFRLKKEMSDDKWQRKQEKFSEDLADKKTRLFNKKYDDNRDMDRKPYKKTSDDYPF